MGIRLAKIQCGNNLKKKILECYRRDNLFLVTGILLVLLACIAGSEMHYGGCSLISEFSSALYHSFAFFRVQQPMHVFVFATDRVNDSYTYVKVRFLIINVIKK